VKELLEQVMPEFEPVPDRVRKVRRRVRARRDRRVVVGAAAAVLAVAAGAGVVAARPDGEMTSPVAAADVCRPGPTYPQSNTDPVEFAHWPLPESASKVTLCVYENVREGLTSQQEARLIGFKEQAGDGSIERKINAGTPRLPGSCPPSGSYRLVLEYQDRSPILLQLSNRCDVSVTPEELLRGDVLDALDQLNGPVLASGS
jgi:hypothetical protein